MTLSRRLAGYVAASGLVVLALGVALLPLLTPPFTRALVARHASPAEAGVTERAMLETAEQVRAFVVAREGVLPARLEGRDAFDESAVGHLEDVAEVIASARVATAALAGLAVLAGLLALRHGHGDAVARALRAAGVGAMALPLIVGVAGALSFDLLFAAFHSLFFAAGTWTFPYDSLLIQLFPEAFWVWSGLAWGASVMLMGAFYGAAARLLERRRRTPAA